MTFIFLQLGWMQDTIRMLYYNILNFPSETPERVEHLKTIVVYAQPDILVVNELLTEDGADLILTDALNTGGVDYFEGASFVNGPDTDNMLYYNTNKLGFVRQYQIPTELRDISEYQLYYKSPGLSSDSDTIWLNMYALYLKAGSGFFARRKEEAQALKFHLNTKTRIENVIVGGDFNFYSGNESGCLTIREEGDVLLFDPINQIGDWHNNSTYTNIHTQSTRSISLADGSGGGMDDRFDLIFVTKDVFDNENGLRFIPGSYKALGQDGDRFNQSINAPFNTALPSEVADALYFMSDHLPVIMDVVTDYTASLNQFDIYAKYDVKTHSIHFTTVLPNKTSFILYEFSGRIILEKDASNQNIIRLDEKLSKGVYVYKFTTIDGSQSGRIFIP